MRLTEDELEQKKFQYQREFGKHLKALRKEKKLTQEEFADRIDRSVDTISALERGLAFAGIDTLVRIAAELDCSMEKLFVFQEISQTKHLGFQERIVSALNNQPEAFQEIVLSQIETLLKVSRLRK